VPTSILGGYGAVYGKMTQQEKNNSEDAQRKTVNITGFI